MKNTISILILLLSTMFCYGQVEYDLITLKDNTQIKGVILYQNYGHDLKVRDLNNNDFIIQEEDINYISKSKEKTKDTPSGTKTTGSHMFNYPVGTKFLSSTSVKGKKTFLLSEITSIEGNCITTKCSSLTGTNTSTTYHGQKIYLMNDAVVYPVPETDGMTLDKEVNLIDYPINPKVGVSLKDIIISGRTGGLPMSMTYKDRKIQSYDTITTPAGKFDCYLLTCMLEIKAGAIKMSSYMETWVSDDVGVVKTIAYKKNKKKIKSVGELEKIETN